MVQAARSNKKSKKNRHSINERPRRIVAAKAEKKTGINTNSPLFMIAASNPRESGLHSGGTKFSFRKIFEKKVGNECQIHLNSITQITGYKMKTKNHRPQYSSLEIYLDRLIYEVVQELKQQQSTKEYTPNDICDDQYTA
jgi:hypothetical protein